MHNWRVFFSFFCFCFFFNCYFHFDSFGTINNGIQRDLLTFQLAYSSCSIIFCHDFSSPSPLSLVYRQLLTLTLTEIRSHCMPRPTSILMRDKQQGHTITVQPMSCAFWNQSNGSCTRGHRHLRGGRWHGQQQRIAGYTCEI